MMNPYIEKQENLRELYQKTGGFIKGICHPSGDPTLLLDAGLGWVRMDAPYPTEESYEPFMQRVADYYQKGIRTVLISPYPSAFVQNGIDPATAAGLEQVEEVCAQMAKDFAPYHPCWQATNEMHMAHFRVPLTEMQAVDFLAASMRGLRKGDPRAAIGHNTVDEAWMDKLLLVDEKAGAGSPGGGADYIGLDLYAGTWIPGDETAFIEMIDRLHDLLKQPVILMEFGFASLGGTMAEDYADVLALLQSWGFKDYEDAASHLDQWIACLPPRLKEIALNAAPEERLKTVSQAFFLHILKKWPCPSFLPHDEVGQAEFYRRLLPKLLDHPYLGGAVIYCMNDSERCFLCGEPDCPLETAWGLLRMDGSKKPAYSMVKNIFRNAEP